MKKALVVGAGGFIGKHLCSALLADGYEVVAADLVKLTFPEKDLMRITSVQIDVAAISDFMPLLENIDVVFYLACTLLPLASNENPVLDIQSNLTPVIRLLEAARNVQGIRIVFASSGGTVYGRSSDVPIAETYPTEPRCSYGVVKLAIEKYLGFYSDLYNIRTVSLRVSNPYGTGQDHSRPQGAIGVFLHKILTGEEINIWGDGSVVRDYIFISDVIDAFMAAANYGGSLKVFNIGSGVGTSLNELLDYLFETTGRFVSVNRAAPRKFDVGRNVLAIELAGNELNWFPCFSLLEGVQILCDNLKEVCKQDL